MIKEMQKRIFIFCCYFDDCSSVAVVFECGNLQVDISKARSVLGWVPPVSVEEGLRRAMAV